MQELVSRHGREPAEPRGVPVAQDPAAHEDENRGEERGAGSRHTPPRHTPGHESARESEDGEGREVFGDGTYQRRGGEKRKRTTSPVIADASAPITDSGHVQSPKTASDAAATIGYPGARTISGSSGLVTSGAYTPSVTRARAAAR
jgi:hypothetical protein